MRAVQRRLRERCFGVEPASCQQRAAEYHREQHHPKPERVKHGHRHGNSASSAQPDAVEEHDSDTQCRGDIGCARHTLGRAGRAGRQEHEPTARPSLRPWLALVDLKRREIDDGDRLVCRTHPVGEFVVANHGLDPVRA